MKSQKTIHIFVVSLSILFLIGSFLPVIAANSLETTKQDHITPTSLIGYILDQSQADTNNHRFTIAGWYLVQSFTPSMSILSRVEILCEIIGHQADNEFLELSIKDTLSLEAPSIATANISYASIRNPKVWVEFIFDNITLSPETRYFMFLSQSGYGDCYWYGNYDEDYYDRGFAYGYNKQMSKWENLSEETIFPDFDFCFKTYSLGDNTAPEIQSIEGASRAQRQISHMINITAVDVDLDEVFLYIDWGDNFNTGWIGPYASGEQIIVNHTWVKMGRYTVSVQAKDIHGNIGEMSTFVFRSSFEKTNGYALYPFFDVFSFFKWVQQVLFIV